MVPSDGGSTLAVGADELRAYLADRLPEYMVPGAFVAIEHVPLTSNGKIDRRALPAPEAGPADASAGYVAPTSEVERTLCGILAEVLRVERVGVHDNYFELGGDSIVAIQIVSRARRAGLWLRPRQLFQHPTVARLALEVGAAGSAGVRTEQGPVTGEVELTPVQRWFFAEEIPERDRWNMPLLLELRRPLGAELLAAALERIVAHHDALRFRYARAADGAWVQTCAPVDAPVPVETVDLAGLADEAAAAQAGLDLEHGPLLRALLLDGGADQPSRLLLVVHHLVVDGVSWRILLEDLETAVEQLSRGEDVTLPAKTTSFQRWARRLAERAARGGFDAELDFWLDEPRRMVRPLPVDSPAGRAHNTVGSSRTLSVSLDADETRALLTEVPAAYRTQVGDVLLCALARAFAGWTGETRLLVELEGHGREELFEDVDLSRTVGWFTTVYPVLLDLRGAEGEGASLKRVKEQLREVPGQGIGYGALRWLSPDAATRGRLAEQPRAEVSFNHLGQADAGQAGDGLFGLAAEQSAGGTSPDAPRQHLLEVNSIVQGGRLRVDWSYGEAIHRRETVEALAGRYLAELRALVAHCVSAEAGGSTPSDFPLAGLSQEELDRLPGSGREVEDVYPLSPLQEGLLFHVLYSRAEGFYLAQSTFELEGELDGEAMRRAWDATLARHPALRASFLWKDLVRPLQVVHRHVHVPFVQDDWRALPEDGQRAALEDYLREDRERGFDLDIAPLMRVALFRTGGDRYRMVWSFLQAVLDGWSLPLVFRDLRAAYEALAAGRTPALGAAPRHRDYVAWVERQDPSRTEAFWRGMLAGFDAPTPLPMEHAAPAGAPERREQADLQLTGEATRALHAFARARGLTPGTVVQGAWALLLARYAGEDDVVFGVTVSGRPAELAGVEEMVGVFINTLPVRVRLAEEAPVDGWLAALQEDAAAVREHESVPLTQVQRWSDVPAGQDLFGSIYVYENYPVDEALAGGIGGVAVLGMAAVERGNYPLTLVVLPGESLRLRLNHDPDRLDPAAAARLLGQVAAAVEAMAALPGARLSQVSLLGDDERTRLLTTWNDTGAGYAGAELVHDMFARQAARAPGAEALRSGERTLTYAALERESNRLAGHLRALGVGPEARVGICLERGPEMVVAVLGVLKAGGAYVPLDPSYPADRLAFMVEDAALAVLLTREGLLERLPEHGARVVCLDRDAAEIARRGDAAPASGLRPENAAYVIYTSGSTGRPKGVEVVHRGLGNYLAWAVDAYAGEGHGAPVHSSLAFDLTVTSLLVPLLRGERVVLTDEADAVEGLARALREEPGFTLVKLTPAHLGLLAEQLTEAEAAAAARTLVVGGEALPAELAAYWRRVAPGTVVVNEYGPTETVVGCIVHRVEDADGAAGSVPIGRPIAGTRAYVLGAGMQPAPLGASGELYVGGAGVARGYLGRPDLTAERFVPDPFGGEPGARLYRTGDRVRWLASGEMEYLGRTDFQLKVRGFRVEPGEIEAALLEDPRVREALVMQREDAAGQRQLVAYVVPAEGAAPSAAELRARLQGVLPDHMVPAWFAVLKSVPLTANGKVDRHALPAPEAAGHGSAAPRTVTEEVLAGIWEDVLGVERVGADDSFFELGGHSLLVTRIVSRVRQALEVEVPLRAIFDAPTVSGLARRIDALRSGGSEAAPPVRRVPRDGPLPLSFQQQRLWLMDRLEPGASTYNMPSALRLRGELDTGALRAALGELARRHEVLRTVFAERDGVPVQVVRPGGGPMLPAIDLRGLPGAAPEREALRLAHEEAVRPFDLERGPLLRTVLLRLGADDHVLCVTMHHAVGDGWSLDVLVGEVAALYGAFGRGEPSPLPELPVQYADYALWQREWLGDDELDRQLAYWKERLAGAPPLLELPTDRPRAAGQSAHAGRHAFAVAADTSRGLRSLARHEGTTLFMTVLAAWQALLGRYSGQDDVVVGTPVAGRTQLETEGLIGLFVNMLVLRAELAGEPTWRELLARVRHDALGAFSHQDLPFERLVDALVTARSLTHAPLFQAVFALGRSRPAPPPLGDAAVRPFGAGAEGLPVDLELMLEDGEDGLAGVLLYREALFDAATIGRMAESLGACLEALAADPSRRFTEVSLLRGSERVQVLEAWNATAADFPQVPAHETFAAQASLTPHVPAVTRGDRVLTYAELDRLSDRLARHLRRRGVGPEVRVGLCLERDVELVVGVLGVLKAGGVYVPLDPTLPAGRLAYMLADADAAVLVSQGGLPERLPAFGGEVVCLDRDAAAIAAEVAGPPPSGVHARSAAYVIYTSGSTGAPKGVVVEHGSLANFAASMRREFPYREGEVVLGVVSFAFDIWIFEGLVPLLAGATVRLLPLDMVRDAAALVEELRTAGRIAAVPALYRQVVLAARLLEPGALAGVRYVFAGGEAVAPELSAELREVFPEARLYVGYGPTEATVLATLYAVPESVEGGAPPIGSPLPNVRTYVLDARGDALPIGIPGELFLGGAGVARGYLGRPDLTAGRFVPDPFSREMGARLYGTGDRVRWRADGALEFLGRFDAQVKIRGFRVELGEVESALAAHPRVHETVAVVREDVPGQRMLVAYVVPEEGAQMSVAELRESLAEQLPDYMVPGAVVVLERLPLDAGGKTDRRALPAPELGAEDGYVAPRTAAEEVLAGIWAEVLELDPERVGVERSFFDMGGHSLLATRVASRIRDAFGVAVPLRTLFEATTVAALAGRVEALQRAGAPAPPPVARLAGGHEGPLPASFAQQRLWVVDRLDPGSPAYNMAHALRVRGPLDAAALRAAFGELTRRHEALRTTLEERGGVPVQVVHPAAPAALPVVELGGLPAAEREREALRLADAEAATPFDLARGPLLRSTLLRLGGADHVLLFTLHHVVSDGWSMQVLVREVAALYAAFARGGSSPLAPLPVQYADFAAWQRRWLSGEVLDEQIGFWRERLAGAPPLLEVPVDRPRAAGQSPRAARHAFALPAELSRRLRALSRAEGTTLFMTLLAAWQALLGRYAGQDDVVVGTPIAGRNRRETEGLIGFFVNMLALRADLGGDPAWSGLLARVREEALGAYAHQDLPFERLVEELGVERSLTHAPLFQAVFALDRAGGPAERPRLGAAALEPFGEGEAVARFDLDLAVADSGDALGGTLVFRAALFDAATVERMAAHLEATLEAMAADPARPLSELSLLRGAERAMVLGAWNDTAADFPRSCLHDRVADWAARTPHAPAVEFADRVLTYAELLRGADRLAHHLRGLGVGPEVRVGLCLERSAEMVVAVLGILRAGGVYLPLDPAHPPERTRFMLADSGAAVVVTRSELAARVAGHGAELVLLDA
ncbi:MAG: amino acid adenylation domain-containing protein, partial [Longimicrobiaceae bacterium]